MKILLLLALATWQPPHVSGPAPLVVFSHGFRGTNRQSRDLMKAVSDAGYIVVAPNHQDAMTNGFVRVQERFGKVRNWNDHTYYDRAEDIARVIDELKADPAWTGKIDWSKVALIGHSLGGYTVLGLAGAWPKWKLSNIKAVVALSPYAQPFTQNASLAKLGVPVMYETGTRDIGIRPFMQGPQGIFTKTSSPAYLVDIAGANHFTWTNLNRDPQKEKLIEYYTINFLNKFVKDDPAAKPETPIPGASVQVK